MPIISAENHLIIIIFMTTTITVKKFPVKDSRASSRFVSVELFLTLFPFTIYNCGQRVWEATIRVKNVKPKIFLSCQMITIFIRVKNQWGHYTKVMSLQKITSLGTKWLSALFTSVLLHCGETSQMTIFSLDNVQYRMGYAPPFLIKMRRCCGRLATSSHFFLSGLLFEFDEGSFNTYSPTLCKIFKAFND